MPHPHLVLCSYISGFSFLFHDHAIFIPKIMPVLCTFPEKYMAFDQTVVFVQGTNGFHLLFCQRILYDTFQVHV